VIHTFVYEPVFGLRRKMAANTATLLLLSFKRELRSNTLLVVVSIFGYGPFFG
jgi:hypothetical protein